MSINDLIQEKKKDFEFEEEYEHEGRKLEITKKKEK